MNKKLICEKCGVSITDGIAWYSIRQYGIEMCVKCQNKEHINSLKNFYGNTKKDMVHA